MKPEQIHIDKIKSAFEKMHSINDLLHLLNEVKPLLYGNKTIPFKLVQLTYYSNPNLGRKRYTKFKIKKKSGSERSIHAPVRGLKAIQKTLSFILQCVYETHPAAMGFVRNRSIVDNAKIHVGSRYVYNIDLKDFFSSIDQARFWKCLQLKPFNLIDSKLIQNETKDKSSLNEKSFITEFEEKIFYKLTEETSELIIDKRRGNFLKYKTRLSNQISIPEKKIKSNNRKNKKNLADYNKQLVDIIFKDAKRYILYFQLLDLGLLKPKQKLANAIAAICCTEMLVERKNAAREWVKIKKNVLPQGAPTSPIISNIVCQRLDFILSGVAKRFGLKYSRYADDITFSSMHNVYQLESDFLRELNRVILEQGFHIKESKTRLQKDGYRKEVTGLLVNENVNVQKRYIKQLRMWLFYWERYGYQRASGFFLQQYIGDKGYVKNGKPNMANVIAGKLDYLKMVKGADNELYLKLKSRFDLLIGFEDPINQILNVWETDGIEQAMDFYYKDKLE